MNDWEKLIPKWVTKILESMTRYRRGQFIRYLRVCLKVEQYCLIQRIGTVAWSYGIEQNKSRSYQYMPLSAMTAYCRIEKVDQITKQRDYSSGYDKGLRFHCYFEPYQLMKEIYNRNEGRLWANTHGISISHNPWRDQSLIKQRDKAKRMYKVVEQIMIGAKPFRLLYRKFLLDKLLSTIEYTPLSEASENLYYYSREHKGSKIMRKIRWGTLNLSECRVIAWAIKLGVGKLRDMIRKLGDDETIIWNLEVGFAAIRTRTEISTIDFGKNEFTEEVTQSRDARSLGFLSHMFGLVEKIKIREMEKQLIEDFAKKLGITVYTPFIHNGNMWKELITNSSSYFGLDGSNWQAVVGMVLGSPISLIFYGWQLLCSGSNVTSLEGLLSMMITAVILFGINKGAFFGDDVMLDRDVAQVKDLVVRGSDTHPKVFLGYNIETEEVMGIKVAVDNSEKMIAKSRLEDVKWQVNKPTLQQKISLLVVYGFMECTNGVRENMKSAEYIVKDDILVNMNQKTWKECLAQYERDYVDWWPDQIYIKGSQGDKI